LKPVIATFFLIRGTLKTLEVPDLGCTTACVHDCDSGTLIDK